MNTVTWEIDDSGVVHLTLNRPKVHNAFNDELITELTASDRLAAMLHTLDNFPVPTVVAVNGATFGGGVGLVASCDIALASDRALFSLSEVRLGLIPATIGPFVVNAIGQRSARRYFLTGERFDATTAARIGLIHDVVPHSDLAEATNAVVKEILSGGPQSQVAAKALLSRLRDKNDEEDPAIWTARLIAEIRTTDEAKSGISAFLRKTPPPWQSKL